MAIEVKSYIWISDEWLWGYKELKDGKVECWVTGEWINAPRLEESRMWDYLYSYAHSDILAKYPPQTISVFGSGMDMEIRYELKTWKILTELEMEELTFIRPEYGQRSAILFTWEETRVAVARPLSITDFLDPWAV